MKKRFLAGWTIGWLSMGITSVCWAIPSTWSGNDHQYEVVSSQGISWDGARIAAQAMGAGWDLVTITSLDEQNFITSLIGPASGSLVEYYIGGLYASGAWGWVTNEPFVFTYWGSGAPNGNASEPRLALDGRFNIPNWGWNDYTGDGAPFTAGYVAERHTASVPEPGTTLLFITGLASLAGFTVKGRTK